MDLVLSIALLKIWSLSMFAEGLKVLNIEYTSPSSFVREGHNDYVCQAKLLH